MGNRSVNNKRLFRYTFLFVQRECIECEHIVQSITELDHKYAHVSYARKKHLSKRECRYNKLFIGVGGDELFVANSVNFCKPFYKMCYVTAIFFLYFFKRRVGIFYDIMQKSGNDHRFICTDSSNNSSY